MPIVVHLGCFIKYHSSGQINEPLAWRGAIEYSHLATWWPSTETSADDSYFHSKRYASGAHVKPTSAMAHFRVEVYIILHLFLILNSFDSTCLFPFDIISYQSTSNEPLLEQPV